jgi:hypothetical protein
MSQEGALIFHWTGPMVGTGQADLPKTSRFSRILPVNVVLSKSEETKIAWDLEEELVKDSPMICNNTIL